MKVAAKVSGASVLAGLARLEREVAGAALDAATDALVREAERAREAAGLSEPVTRDAESAFTRVFARQARRRLIGSRDPAAVVLELGTLERPPAPWLAPVLATARGAMRAAASAAIARFHKR
jgi:hypothetical protein